MAWPHLFRAIGPLFPQCCRLHLAVFLLTFASYTLFHASGKTFSNVKIAISSYSLTRHYPNSTHLYLNEQQAILLWGTLDTAFVFSHALGLYIKGVIGESINLWLVMAFGMCSSALVSLCFGTITKYPQFYSERFYFFLWVLNGVLEATGWPCVVAIVDGWFGTVCPGFVYGLWSVCATMGNMLGSYVASLVLQNGYSHTFLVMASMKFAAGLIIICALCILPQEIGAILTGHRSDSEEDFDSLLMDYEDDEISEVEEIEYNDVGDVHWEEDDVLPQPTAFSEASRIPGVLRYFLTKLVNYSFFFWLPFYISNSLGWRKAQICQFSVGCDADRIVDGTILGFLSDTVQKKSMLAVCALLITVFNCGYFHVSQNKAVNALLLIAIIRLFIGGPSNVLGSVTSNDIQYHEQMKESREGSATVTGIVDGTINMGMTREQYLISLIQEKVGWMCFFYFLVLMRGFSIFLISLLLFREQEIMYKKGQPIHLEHNQFPSE